MNAPVLSGLNGGGFGWLDSDPTAGNGYQWDIQAWSHHPAVPNAVYLGRKSNATTTFALNTDTPPVLASVARVVIDFFNPTTVRALVMHNTQYSYGFVWLLTQPLVVSGGDQIALPVGYLKIPLKAA